MPTSLNCGWIRRRSTASSFAISASRHSRSRSRTSRQGASAATEQSSKDAAQQRIAELASNRRRDRAAGGLNHLVGHGWPGGLTGLAGFLAIQFPLALRFHPLGFALLPGCFPVRGGTLASGFLV